MRTLEEIKSRALEIEEELRKEDITNEELNTLEKEMNDLEEEKRKLDEIAEKRSVALSKAISFGTTKENIVERKEDVKMDNKKMEYRNAFLKKLQGKELTEVETRAFALAGVTGALPEETADEVIKKMKLIAPILDEVTLLRVAGAVKFAVEGDKASGEIHTENSSISADADTLVEVALVGYEVTKLIQISESVKTMSIASFESWLAEMIAEMIADKVEDLVFNGTGSSQPKGVSNANVWGEGNKVEVQNAKTLTNVDVLNFISLLPAGYDKGAKIAMNKHTLFGDFMPLQDNAKHGLVNIIDGKYYIYGYEVILTDKVKTHDAYLGNFKKYVANLGQDINVKNQYDINTNSYKYLGTCIFDGKPAIGEAFVKLTKAEA